MESFNLIRELLKIINLNNYPFLKPILIINKLDLESEREISAFQIKEYLKNNKLIDSIEISIKYGDNIPGLIQKINKVLYEPKNLFPLNIIWEKKKQKFDGCISLILIGDECVGKTTFFNWYFKNTFTIPFSTIGIDKEIKQVLIGNLNYKLTVWDTAGQERFKCLLRKYYKNSDGILLFFDLTNEQSFINTSSWMKDVNDNINDTMDISLFLIGNKIDRHDRVISREKAEKIAKSLGVKYFEVSAKLNLNTPEIMARIIMECHMRFNHINNISEIKQNIKNTFNSCLYKKLFKFINY